MSDHSKEDKKKMAEKPKGDVKDQSVTSFDDLEDSQDPSEEIAFDKSIQDLEEPLSLAEE